MDLASTGFPSPDFSDIQSDDGHHEIRNQRDLDRVTARLNSSKVLRSLSASQLPSQAVSTGLPSPVEVIQHQLASLNIIHNDSTALSDKFEGWLRNIGEEASKLLKMAVNQGYFTFEVTLLAFSCTPGLPLNHFLAIFSPSRFGSCCRFQFLWHAYGDGFL
jgi:hypothetical protein